MADIENISLNGTSYQCADSLYRDKLPLMIISYNSTSLRYEAEWKGDTPIPFSTADNSTPLNCLLYSNENIEAGSDVKIYYEDSSNYFYFSQTGLENSFQWIYRNRVYLCKLLLKTNGNINYLYINSFYESYAPLNHLSSVGNDIGVGNSQYYGHVKATTGLIKRFSYNISKVPRDPAPWLNLPTITDYPSLATPQVIEITCSFLQNGKDNEHDDYFWLSNGSSSGLYYKVLGMGNQYRFNFKKDPVSGSNYYFPYNVSITPFFNPYGMLDPGESMRDYEMMRYGNYNVSSDVYDAAEGILMRLYVSANRGDIENIDDHYEINNGSVTVPTVTTSAGAGVPPFNLLL